MANYITTDTELTSIANAIRTKGGTQASLEYPAGFVTAIGNISGGGGVDPDWLTFTDDMSYFNAGGLFNEFLLDNISLVSATGVYRLSYLMANDYRKTNVDFSGLNIVLEDEVTVDGNGYFNDNYNVAKLPTISRKSGATNSTIIKIGGSFLYNAKHITTLENAFPANGLIGQAAGATSVTTNFCCGCECLRVVPNNLFYQGTQPINNYGGWFQNCYVLDKVENLPVSNTNFQTNAFNGAFSSAWRVNKITFQTNNGTPYDINVNRNLTWTFVNVGYAPSYIFNLIDYGIDSSKLVNSTATYNQLKNDPDWYTNDIAYSRFNHDSAVALINSLPNNTNSTNKITISLPGGAGSATDGGAINTLTAEEIAVATNKNWIISIT